MAACRPRLVQDRYRYRCGVGGAPAVQSTAQGDTCRVSYKKLGYTYSCRVSRTV